MNVTLGRGKVHKKAEGLNSPECGGNRASDRYRATSAEVDCKKCLAIIEATSGAPVDAVTADAAMITPTTNQGEKNTMADKPEVELSEEHETIIKVMDNVDQAKTLAANGYVDEIAALKVETETLISTLPTRGKTSNGSSWTAAKKELREKFKAAATLPKTAPKKPAPKAEVEVKVVAPPAKTYDQYEGVPELVTMGAERAAEGVRLHIKTSTTARELAAIGLDMWRRIENKDGNPDLLGDSDAAKKASTALKEAAGKALAKDGLDAFDVDQAVKKLWRAVQTQRTDVRAEYLRGLDADTEEAAAEREHFANILKDKPEDVTAAEWIARDYDVSLKGQTELQRERYHAKKELEASEKKTSDDGDDDSENEEQSETQAVAPEEHMKAVVAKIMRDVKSAKPEAFEQSNEEAKAEVRADLEKALNAIKDMLKAVL